MLGPCPGRLKTEKHPGTSGWYGHRAPPVRPRTAISGLPVFGTGCGRGRKRSYAGRMSSTKHQGFDHVTIAVTDLDEAKRFFGLLGFEETASTVVSGDEMSRYMGIPGWEADHVTLALTGVTSHQEVQLLRFHHPTSPDDPDEANLARLGFNHVCFAVNDLDAALERLVAGGVRTRNSVMEFHDRRLVFLVGPEMSPSNSLSGRSPKTIDRYRRERRYGEPGGDRLGERPLCQADFDAVQDVTNVRLFAVNR